MTASILQYHDPLSLVDGTIEYQGAVITAQREMSSAYRRHQRCAHDLNSLLRDLLFDWYSPLRMFRQHLLISRLIDEASPAWSVEMKRVFSNNKGEILRSFRNLVEIGVPPKKLPADDDERRLFSGLYSEFAEAAESGVRVLFDELQKWRDPASFRQALLEAGLTEKELNAVYFQGFYYIRPMQSRFIDAVLALETKVCFLNAFDPSDPIKYRIWDENPRYANGKMTVFSADDSKAPGAVPRKPQILKFEDLFSMVCYLRRSVKKERFYAPMSDDVREILETFFQKDNEKESLLSYPVGRYLLALYEMWDGKAGALSLDAENVRECLSTGWAGESYSENMSVLSTFNKVRHYFSDCRTIREWEARLERLEEVFSKVLPLFDRRTPENSTLLSPFASIGAFNASPADVKLLLKILKQMMKDAQYLFGSGAGEIDVAQHFKNVLKMLKKKSEKNLIHEEEKQILEKLSKRLNWNSADIQSCPAAHLADAMTFFLGGRRDDPAEGGHDEQIGGVRGISDIESAHLLCTGVPVHLCFCDAGEMPGKARSCSWPLSAAYLSTLTLKPKAAERLKDYLFFMESTALSNRYLFALAAKLPELTVSWVGRAAEKEKKPSIYVKLLSQDSLKFQTINGLLLSSSKGNPEASAAQPAPEWGGVLSRAFQGESSQPAEYGCCAQFCPRGFWRLLYDYILSDGPCFSEEFHLKHLMPLLICLLSDALSITIEKAAQEVFSLYPSFTPSERQELMDWAKRERKKVRLPDNAENDDLGTLRRLYVKFLDQTNYMLENPGYKPSEMNCMYFPHGSYCFARHNSGKMNEHGR